MAKYKNVENIKQLFDEKFKKTTQLIQLDETHLDNLAEGFLEADRVISKLPTADVVEVRHSYWQCSNVRISSRDITCKYCHRTEIISNGSEDFEYCPHCGAKMDKDGGK